MARKKRARPVEKAEQTASPAELRWRLTWLYRGAVAGASELGPDTALGAILSEARTRNSHLPLDRQVEAFKRLLDELGALDRALRLVDHLLNVRGNAGYPGEDDLDD